MEIELDERGAEKLRGDLSKLGFTLSKSDLSVLVERLPENIQDFVNAIFVAEGANPDVADRHLWRQVVTLSLALIVSASAANNSLQARRPCRAAA